MSNFFLLSRANVAVDVVHRKQQRHVYMCARVGVLVCAHLCD